MSNKRLTVKYIKQTILELLQREVKFREEERGTGVFLAENIDSYYMKVGAIRTLQQLCKYLNIETDLTNYDPYETEEDDNKYNYCINSGFIGKKSDFPGCF